MVGERVYRLTVPFSTVRQPKPGQRQAASTRTKCLYQAAPISVRRHYMAIRAALAAPAGRMRLNMSCTISLKIGARPILRRSAAARALERKQCEREKCIDERSEHDLPSICGMRYACAASAR